MRDISLIRRFEPLFIIGIAAIYVNRRLIEEVNRVNVMVGSAAREGIPEASFLRDLANYNHTLNTTTPLIAGICLFLGAWYVFHNLAYPLLTNRINDRKGWLYTGLAALLLLLSVFIYHYLKLYVRYRHDIEGDIIGLKADSLFRVRTVLADTIGFGILLCVYEIAFSYYTYLASSIQRESEAHFRLVSLLSLAGISILFVSFALNGYLPRTLWRDSAQSDILLILGLGIQIYFAQEYAYRFILPKQRSPQASKIVLFSYMGAYLLMILIAATTLWGAATNFYFPFAGPLVLFPSIVLIGSLSIAYVRQLRTKEKTVLQTQVSTKSAELVSLRAQINPHFLFNALNSLYATALREKGDKTAEGIQRLGDMMRFMLQENNRDRIPLDKEVEYLHNYIQIQRMRIDETHPIEIRVNIQESSREIYLAPMLLTPFVENAFKHGISLRNPSWIYITLTLDATKLYFKVHNSRHSRSVEPAEHHDPERFQSGVGLDNVRKRLELIYPDRHTLDIQQSEQDYFVSLTLVYW